MADFSFRCGKVLNPEFFNLTQFLFIFRFRARDENLNSRQVRKRVTYTTVPETSGSSCDRPRLQRHAHEIQ